MFDFVCGVVILMLFILFVELLVLLLLAIKETFHE